MKFGIVCAGDEELAPFLPMMDHCKVTERARLKFYEGQIDGTEVVALFSGVCKVNAAIASQILIDILMSTRLSIRERQAEWIRGSKYLIP